jgi:membrane protein required for colicin V production
MSSIFSTIKDFGIIDSVALIIILFFLIRGFRQGASGEIGSMLAWLLTGAFFFFGFSWIMEEIMSFSFLHKNPSAAHFMAFIITLFISVAIWFLLRKMLTDSIGLTIPTPFNEILGTFFGILKSILLIAFLCILGLFNPSKGESHRDLNDSTTVKLLHPIITKITQR